VSVAKILKCACGQELDIEGFQAGQQVQCPKCDQALTVPSASPAVAMIVEDEDDLPPAGPNYADPAERRRRSAKRELGHGHRMLRKVIIWPCLVLGLASLWVAYKGIGWSHVEPKMKLVNEGGFDVLYARPAVGVLTPATIPGGPLQGQSAYQLLHKTDGSITWCEKVETVTGDDGKLHVYVWEYPFPPKKEDAEEEDPAKRMPIGPAVKIEPFSDGEVLVEQKGQTLVVYQRVVVKPSLMPGNGWHDGPTLDTLPAPLKVDGTHNVPFACVRLATYEKPTKDRQKYTGKIGNTTEQYESVKIIHEGDKTRVLITKSGAEEEPFADYHVLATETDEVITIYHRLKWLTTFRSFDVEDEKAQETRRTYQYAIGNRVESCDQVDVLPETGGVRILAVRHAPEGGKPTETEVLAGQRLLASDIDGVIRVYEWGLTGDLAKTVNKDVLGGGTVEVVNIAAFQSAYWFYEVKRDMDDTAARAAQAAADREAAERGRAERADQGLSARSAREEATEVAPEQRKPEAASSESKRTLIRRLDQLPVMADPFGSDKYVQVVIRGTKAYRPGDDDDAREVPLKYYKLTQGHVGYQDIPLDRFHEYKPPFGIPPHFFIWAGSIIGGVLMLAFAFFLYEAYFSKQAKQDAERLRAQKAAEQTPKA
jgi:hypothetical protein